MTPGETVPGDEGPVSQLLVAADAMAAELAIGGLDAGPAAEQAGLTDLRVDEAPVGAWAAGSDGTLYLALLGPGGAARWPDPTQLVLVLQAGAGASGASVDGLEVFDDVSQLPAGIDGGGLTWAGAGVFDGDLPVASVGVAAGWTAPGAALDPDDADAVVPSADEAAAAQSPETTAATAPATPATGDQGSAPRNLHLLAEVALAVTAELGRTTMTMGELLDLHPGGVIELEREAGAPIDIAVNSTLIARGEVVMVGGRYAVRITEVVSDGGGR
jgi:flagellar motor switch protein FliN/FliY